MVVVVDATDDEVEWLDRYLVIPSRPGPQEYAGAPTKLLTRPLDTPSHFAAGLLPIVRRAAARADTTIEIEDARGPPPVVPHAPPEHLRDYQTEAVLKALKATRGIIHEPTGAGKGQLIAALADMLPCRWIILTHKSSIAKQIADVLHERNVEDVAFWDRRKRTGRVTVATFQAAYKGSPLLADVVANAEAMMIDEVHSVAAPTFFQVAQSCTRARWRFGFSATPLARSDKQSLRVIAATGPVIARTDFEELADRGILAKPIVRMVRMEHPKPKVPPPKEQPPVRPGDLWVFEDDVIPKKPWKEIYRDDVVKSKLRNAMVIRATTVAKWPAILFVSEVTHGKALAATLKKAGVRVAFASGTKDLSARSSIISGLNEGEIDVCVSTVVFQDGIDVPNLQSVVIGSAGKSAIASVQRVGRATRATGNKSTCEVWDIWDMHHEILGRQARARRRAYEAEGFDTHILQLDEVFRLK